MTCYPLCRCDWLTTSLTVLLSPHFMDKPTEVWNFISRNEALEVGPRKISFVRPLPHSFIHNSPTHQPPFTSPWNGKSSLSPNPRVSGPCSGRKEQIPEWEHEQACSCVTNCFDIMERSLSYYGVFFWWESFSYNAGWLLSLKVNNYIILYRESQEKGNCKKISNPSSSLALFFKNISGGNEV